MPSSRHGQTHIFDHLVQWLQEHNHALRILVREVQPGSLFKTFVPHLVPKNGYTDEFVTDDVRLSKISWLLSREQRRMTYLFHYLLAVVPHVIHDGLCCVLPRRTG